MRSLLTTVLLVCIVMNSAWAHNTVIIRDTTGHDTAAGKELSDMVKGKISGVRVAETTGSPLSPNAVTVRGLNSVRGMTQPLYIVNGVILENSSHDIFNPFWNAEGETTATLHSMHTHISPYDIESIRVLKDASATAAYGKKGANGVIIINTRPSSARNSRTIEWNSNVGINIPDIRLNPSVEHSHYLRISSRKELSSFNISANFRNTNGVTPSTSGNFYGLCTDFETRANKFFTFSTTATLGMGNVSDMTGQCRFMEDSYTLDLRKNIPSKNSWETDYDDKSKIYAATAGAQLQVNILPFLHWKTTAGCDFRGISRSFWYGTGTVFGLAENGAASLNTSRIISYNLNSAIELDRHISNHSLAVSAAFDIFGNQNSFNTIEGEDFFTKELRANGLNLMNSAQYTHRYSYSYQNLALIGTLSYSYRHSVGINCTVRADRCSKYSDTFIIYPGVSAYVNFADLLTMDKDVVNNLSLEGGWGISGFEKSVPNLSVEEEVQPYFDNLYRLTSKEWNAGINLSILKNRISLLAKYYDRQTDDMFQTYCFGTRGVNYWYYSDRKLHSSQLSRITNKGIEIDLHAEIISRKDFRWVLNLNATWNANKLSSRDYSDLQTNDAGIFSLANLPGNSIGCILGYDVDDEGYYIDRNRDGMISAADCRILGSGTPEFNAGLESVLSYRGFTFELMTDAVTGHELVDLNRLVTEGYDKVTPRYVYSGDFFRLSKVGIRYDVPIHSKRLKGLSVFASGHNLIYISKYGGWNPDVQTMDLGSYPYVRSFIGGIRIKF